MSDTQAQLDRAVRELVEHTADVRGVVLGSADGHPLAACLDRVPADAATVAAMGAATAGLATRLIKVGTESDVANSHIRGDDGQVWVLDVGRAATLTVFATRDADPDSIAFATRNAVERLVELLVAAADADTGPPH